MTHKTIRFFVVPTFISLLTCCFAFGIQQEDSVTVSPPSKEIREKFKLDDFYHKHVLIDGFPIVGSKDVSDAAIREAKWIVGKMLDGRSDILKAMAANNTRLAVMAFNEYTTDIPEHRKLKPRIYWDRRARGLGATPRAPAVSCAEENLLCHPNDPYSTENILIHEFAHAIHQMGMNTIDPTFDKRLRESFERAKAQGLWKNTYAMSNRMEYWAEGVQSWFDNNRDKDELHNDVNTRVELKEYDPMLAKLCEEVFGDKEWKYKKPMDRSPAERSHLKEVDFNSLPSFKWRKEKVSIKPVVKFETTEGNFELELYADKSPKTVENFLYYVHEGFYSGGNFFRTVTLNNQPDNEIKIEVVQASANSKYRSQFRRSIPLERTNETSVKHESGVISMGRSKPDSATHHFFICIGDQPELDFGGQRNPDGQGFAAFGKVTTGMDVVKKIQTSKSNGQNLTPKIKIQRAIRLN